MSIEKSLERIADALEIIAGGRNEKTAEPSENTPPADKKTTKKKTAAKKTTAAGKSYSEDDLRLCFQEYVGRKGNEEGTANLKALIGKHGAAKIGEVKPEDYGIIIEEVKTWK